jgi:DNA polymerase
VALHDAPPGALPPIAADLARAGRADMAELRDASAGCHACDLWQRATQTVFGVGPVPARLMLVGEQPGDQEDRQGKPFVGPAGRVLAEALERAGIDREEAFVTNVVKHFRWRPAPGSKRRLHERPNREQVGACLPWVESELALVRPEALVLLGATAANALVGDEVRVTRDHGRRIESTLAPLVIVTIHPSAVLRSRDRPSREAALEGMVADLSTVAGVLA